MLTSVTTQHDQTL